jgi:type IX secretion system PorP/SprF family membrane protein
MHNTRFRFFLLLAMMWVLGSSGQELNSPQLSQYLADNPFVLAPTYAGIGDHVKIRLNGLSQWVGIKDAPQTQSLAADARIGNRSGVGVFLYNDRNGYTRQQGARLSFAHHLTLDKYEDEFLSFGISYNFNQFRIDVEEFQNIVQPDF